MKQFIFRAMPLLMVLLTILLSVIVNVLWWGALIVGLFWVVRLMLPVVGITV